LIKSALVASPVVVALAVAIAVVLGGPFVLDLPTAWAIGLVGHGRAREGKNAQRECSDSGCDEFSHDD
jgi:hypothetical protein